MVSIEGGGKSKIGKVRFWVRGLTISPPDFNSCFLRARFLRWEKIGGNSWAGPPRQWQRQFGTIMTVTKMRKMSEGNGDEDDYKVDVTDPKYSSGYSTQ
jgi:hypothetical protein